MYRELKNIKELKTNVLLLEALWRTPCIPNVFNSFEFFNSFNSLILKHAKLAKVE